MNEVIFQIIGLFISYIFVFLIIVVSYILRKRGISDKTARKVVHIGVGNWIILALFIFKDWFFAIIGPVSFIVLNYFSYKKNLFGGSMELDEKRTLGTVYYAIALSILVFFFWFVRNGSYKWVASLGVLSMTWGDGMASVIGQRWGRLSGGFKLAGNEKSYSGSIAMFVFSFIPLFLVMIGFGELPFRAFVSSVMMAVIATFVEAITSLGLDNLTVPISVSFIYYVYFCI
ncbi:MAG: diacylglycerol/polyprenol kinase family protein [bacterium]